MKELPGRMCYNKLFALAEQKGIKACDLKYQTPYIRSDLFKHLREGGNCTVNTLAAVCEVLKCQPGDIMEYIPLEPFGREDKGVES